MKIGNIINEGLAYHIENGIPLHESIYRLGTDKYFETFAEARRMYKEGKLKDLHEWDEEILRDTDLGEWANIKGVGRVPLDMPISEEEHAAFEAKQNELNELNNDSGWSKPGGTYTISQKKNYTDKVDSRGTATMKYDDTIQSTDHQNKRTDWFRDTEKSVEKGGKQSYTATSAHADDTGQTTFYRTDNGKVTQDTSRYERPVAIAMKRQTQKALNADIDRLKKLSGLTEGEQRPYICVHAKKGKHECKAESSYQAAKKAAEHWGLKSTAGIDAHLADKEKVAESRLVSELNADMFKQGAKDANKLAKSAVDMHSKADAAMANSPIAKTQQYKDYQKTNMDNKKAAMKQGMPYGRQDIGEGDYTDEQHPSVDFTREVDEENYCYDCKLVSNTIGEIETENDENDVVCPRCGSEAYVEASDEEIAMYSEAKRDTHCSDKCCGSDVKREDCGCQPDCPHCNCNAKMDEAEYQGKKVELSKPKRGGSKKFYVYVRNPKTKKIKKVAFGAASGGGSLAVKLKDPKARKAFADRHNCTSKNDKTKPGYWSCRLPRYAKSLGLSGGGTWW